MTLAALKTEVATINDLLCALNLLVWDSRTMMPAGGAESRGRQIATLTMLARERLLGDALRRALDGAETEAATLDADSDEAVAVARVREAVAFHDRIPADLIERRAAARALSNAAWIEARERSDFSIFRPWLESMVATSREYADAIGWARHPYDAMVGLYEPGETVESLATLFATLRAGLGPILEQARSRPDASAVLRRRFPTETQLTLARRFSAGFGYDMERGRLDTTVHPFEISHTRGDVRITTRCNPDFLSPALFGALHETGHALYEQNVDPAFTRTVFATDLLGLYAVGGASFGAHESQSRLIENHVGRSRDFWRLNFPALRSAFPDALSDIDADQFYAAVTTVSPGLIRTDADEVTYDFHIMLRVEFETALIAGDLKSADLPDAWATQMRESLGVTVREDRTGCLQDIHWSSGSLGSFCTYTIGNVMAAQLFERARQADGVSDGLERGDAAPLGRWLNDAVWRHGRRRSREELLRRSTGRGLDTAPYLAYLSEKYGASAG